MASDLTRYIHPRYVGFTTFFTTFALCVLVARWFIGEDTHTHSHTNTSKAAMTLTLTIIVLALILPPQSLSQRAATTRLQETTTGEVSENNYDQFSTDYSHFSLREWSTLIASQPDPEAIVGKSAVLEGFYLEKDSQGFIARFQIACCSVDATPLSVPIMTNESLTPNSWYTIEGVAAISSDNEIFIEAGTITAIPEPETPYVF